MEALQEPFYARKSFLEKFIFPALGSDEKDKDSTVKTYEIKRVDSDYFIQDRGTA